MADIKYKNGNMYINGNSIPIEALGYTSEEAEQAFGGDVFDRNILTASSDCCFNAVADNCAVSANTLSELTGYASNNWATGTTTIGISSSVDAIESNLQEIQKRITVLEEKILTPAVHSLKDLRRNLKTLNWTREV